MKPDIVTRGGSQIDTSRTARMLIERHGRDAVLVAARWADCAARSGNRERAAAWRQIVDIVTRRCTITVKPEPTCRLVSAESCAA